MNDSARELENLRRELAEVKERLKLAESTLEAIRGGEVDALVVNTPEGNRIFTLQGADHTYQRLIEQMSESAVTVSDDGLILYCNQRLSQLVNFPLNKLIGSHLQNFIAPQDHKTFLLLLQQVHQEQTLTCELSLITIRSHQQIPVKLSLKQLAINDLFVNSIIITDITESKVKEAAKLNQVLNRAIAAMASYRAFPDQTWVVDYWSPGCELLFGYTAEELIADPNLWTFNVHPEDLRYLIDKAFSNLQQRKINEVEYRFRHQDGSWRWISSSQLFEWNDDHQCWLVTGIFVDITKRKQAEIALFETQESLTIAVEAAQMGTWYLDLTNDVSSRRSPRHDQIFGYDTPQTEWGEAIARKHVLQADWEIWDAAFAKALETGNLNFEVRIKWSDGSIHWMAVYGRFYFDDNGKPLYGAGINLDITERKQAEIALQEQITRERLVSNITQNIRETLELDQVLQATVAQVREFFQADRVVVFRFDEDGDGLVIAESLVSGWPSLLFQRFQDECCTEHYFTFSQADFYARTDISTLEPCYTDFFAPFKVKASLTVPICQAQQLWGYLIVHQCSSTRLWQTTEIELLQQLATQVSIAIKQSELYEQTRQELQERKKAQESLFISEQRLKALMEYAPAVIFILDLEDRLLLVSRCYEELVGITAENVIGKSIYDFWPQAIADVFANNNRQIVQTQQVLEVEETAVHADGLHTYITWKFPLYDTLGKVYAVCGISTDITERKQAESKIAEQADLIDLATDAIFVHDLDNQILFWSKGAERLYGWTKAEVLGQKTDDLFNQGLDLTEALQTTLTQGTWQGELKQVTKAGKKITVDSHKTLVENQFSQAQSILVVNSNITEKKLLEKQFYHIQRLESLGTLASGIAHDFNNILTPILGISQLLPLKLPNLDDNTKELLDLLTSSARRGADLVKQILLFSRNTDGQWVTLQLGYLLLELIGIAKQTFPKSITISANIPTRNLWTISADTSQMHQVFMNLMVNARDAMDNGGTLTISAENRDLDEYYTKMNLEAKAGPYVVVTVTDTGTGIPLELKDRIFDPFFTTKGVGKGTGLGLSTVVGIVKNHGGFIRVYSELGKGAQFDVFLPAIEGEVAEATFTEEFPRGNGELILVVDDESSIQEVTKTFLENYNYQVLIAGDGQEALSIYAQYQQEISVVLMDMMMPNLDGVTAMRTLQQINPLVKIIATSGLLANSQWALEADVKTFLLKPYTIKQLLQTLTEVLGNQVTSFNQNASPIIFPNTELLKSALATMSPDWLKQMYQAAYCVDADMMLELIAQIADSEPVLANTLKNLVHNFNTDTIMELTESILSSL